MNIRRDEVSLGALALILCLALPMGVLSLFAPQTTADEVDAADSVLLARITAMQTVRASGVTLLQFERERVLAGREPQERFELQIVGRPPLEVGDLVLTMLSFDPPSLHGAYQVRKNPRSLDYEVLTEVTGLSGQGVYGVPPLALDFVESGIRMRRGLGARTPRSSGGASETNDEDEDSSSSRTSNSGRSQKSGTAPAVGTGDDHGNDIPSATPVILKSPHLVTGMPTEVTGLLTPGDVDYFSFQAPKLSLLHAELKLPEGVTSLAPDTFMGLFNGMNGELLAFDDDSGEGTYSAFVVPVEDTGLHAVAVEGAPDPDLDFSGNEGMQTGPYTLSLELEEAAYLSNFLDMIVGVSEDGTFVEDFVGFKRKGGLDVLREGVIGDGWGLEYDANLPGGLSHVYGGTGDYLVPPAFNAPVERSLFSLGWFGDNRRGQSQSMTTLPYQKDPRRGVSVGLDYKVQLSQSVVAGNIELGVGTTDRIYSLEFRRLLDVDLFGVGADTFYWSFDPADDWQVFPTDVTESLDAPTPPVSSTGSETGDLQVALVATAGNVIGGSVDNPKLVRFPMAFTLVDQFVSEIDAVQSAVQNLLASDTETWTVAVDADPTTGLYTAFGIGLGARID